MLGELESALDVGLALARRLRERNISYALGGALALGVAGILRATRDVDLNVFIGASEIEPVLGILEELGVPVDRTRAKHEAQDEGLFVVWAGPWRVDVFVASIDFAREAERTRVQVKLEGEPFWFLSPEALAVFKLLFFRPKDLVDLEQLVQIRDDLDVQWVRRHVAEMMGEDDARVAAWDAAVAAAAAR